MGTKAEILRARYEQGDPEDLRRMAADPDLPLDLLDALAVSYPDPVASNPLWPRLLLDSPNILDTFSQFGLRALLGCEQGVWLLPVAASSPSADVRVELARCPRREPPMPELLARLAEDPDWWVRAQIAARVDTPEATLRRLASDEEHEVRSCVATNPNTPVDLLPVLLSDKNLKVRDGATLHPGFSKELLATLALSEDEENRIIAAFDHRCPPDLLRSLSRDPSPRVREGAAFNEKTPPECLEMLASDASAEVRRSVACNSATPPGGLWALLGDPEVGVVLAHRNKLPPEIAAKLLEQGRDVLRALLQNKSLHGDFFSEEILRGINMLGMLEALAVDPTRPPEQIAHLARHPNPRVHLLAASNPACPLEVVQRLLAEGTPEQRQAAASNPALGGTE